MNGPHQPATCDHGDIHRPEHVPDERTMAVLCAAVVGLISLGLYLATLAPGLTWAHDSADGGELAAAASTLGIAHPPGYPTYVLLAHPFTLLPLGEVATRTNLFSALCAACTAALLSWTLIQTGARRTSAIGAGLALACSPLLWSQAIVTEVHALNSLFTALLLAFAATAMRRDRRPAAWLALATGWVWGVGMGNHPTLLLCGPLVLLAWWRMRKGWICGPLGLALGLLVYLYLPIRAGADPPINWGNPRTPAQFWWTVSGGPYRQFLFALPWAYLPARLLAWLALLRQQFTWFGLLVAFVGGATLWNDRRPLFLTTGATMILYSIFAVGYNTSDSQFYLIPALVCLGLWLGTGIDRVLSALGARWSWTGRWGAVAVVTLPLVVAVWRFPALDLSHDRQASQFERVTLEQAPPQAIILSRRDSHTFSLWYGQVALGKRPDVLIVDLDLLAYEWYTDNMYTKIATQAWSQIGPAAEVELPEMARVLNRPTCRIGPEGLECALPPDERVE